MWNWFTGSVQFNGNLIKNVCDSLSTVEDRSGLLVTFEIMLSLSLKLSIDSFILQNFSEATINFFVQDLVLLEKLQMITFESVSFQDQAVMLAFSLTHIVFWKFQSFCKLSIFLNHNIWIIANCTIFALWFYTLLLQNFCSAL